MYRGPHPSPEIGRAGVDVSVLGVKHEVFARLCLDRLLHSLDALRQSHKHSLDVTAFLHGNDPQLVFLVDPDQECFLLVVEDAAPLGPVALHPGRLQVPVSGHEEKVIVHKLLPVLLGEAAQGEVAAGQVPSQAGEGCPHQGLHLAALVPRDARGEAEPVDGAANADSDRMDRGGRVHIAA